MYTLRFPFELTDGRSISDLPQERAFGRYHACLKHRSGVYVLAVSGFPDEATARAYEGQIRVAVHWLVLECNLATRPIPSLQDVHYFDDPASVARKWAESSGGDWGDRIDGVIDGSRPAVYRTDDSIRAYTIGRPGATVTQQGDKVVGKLLESIERFPGATADHLGEAATDNQLETALDLYRAHLAEQSVQAQFLTVVMALEALCKPCDRPDMVQELLDDFSQQIQAAIEAGTPDADTRESLEALRQDFRSRQKQDSIGSQLRRLVKTSLASDDDAEEMARQMTALYNKRSRLTHGRAVSQQELGDALPHARNIARRVLRARIDSALLQASATDTE
jgi:hypothetical protein